MKSENLSFRAVFIFIIISFISAAGQERDALKIVSTKEVGQIETGSPFVGVEIHKSFPLLNRISFYYPVANSIDISEDYWKRENFRIMSFGIKAGSSHKRMLKNQVYEVMQTPYSASFSGKDLDSKVKISYGFCKDQPAMVITYEITNDSDTEKDYEFYTRMEVSLRTSHTYQKIDSGYTEYQPQNAIIRINYPYVETGNSQVFIMNAGIMPESFTSAAINENGFDNPDDLWLNTDGPLPGKTIGKKEKGKPAAAFIYKKTLAPGGSAKIIQIVGSSLIAEAGEKTDYLSENYRKEVKDYEDYILSETFDKDEIVTGDNDFDFTSRWAKAIIAANAHYLNGYIVPMPAQAEYNFYFTHDALLTDLAAVNFDLKRVRNDLQYIISLADTDKTIPHAYYWKDTTYRTEFAGTENWNHFWFTLLCARYLRHSGDTEFSKQLYPYVEQSIRTAMKNKGNDDLMWSFRPDWWDIGNNFGPRAYMTILAIRALREFNYISAVLKKDPAEIKMYEETANRMNGKLTDRLWDNRLNYLISYFADGKEDEHIYMGSLLASHFNLLDKDKNLKLVTTAKENLLDEKLGLYTLFPMDLHLLTDYMGFAGNEAGAPYHYANGGIWPHGNSWYALSLISNGLYGEASGFIRKTMTMNGIINSPNGQPALYEYRISDKNDLSVYGKIDKPQFLWAGGWYFYTLYNLFGLRENEWNISFDPFIPDGMDSVKLNVTVKGNPVQVGIEGKGNRLASIRFDGKEIPSAVIPDEVNDLKRIEFKLGREIKPYLKSANAMVFAPVFDSSGTLSFDLESFEGHLTELQIVSPASYKSISLNGKDMRDGISEIKNNGVYEINLKHKSDGKRNHYSIKFK